MLKNKIQIFPFLFLIAALNYPVFCQTNTELFDYHDYIKNSTGLGNLQFSPDGKNLLFSTSKANLETNQRNLEYYLMDLISKTVTKLEFKHKSVRNIQWSPSGKYLSFSAVKDGRRQLIIQEYPLKKMVAVIEHPTNIARCSWSPDETKIAFVAQDERPQRPDDKKFVTAFEVGTHGYLDDGPFLSSNVHIFDISKGKTEQLTEGKGDVSSGISWSTDSKSLVFTMEANALPSGWNDNKIMFFHLATKTLVPFSDREGFEYAPNYSPDGKHLVFKFVPDQNPAGMADIFIQSENNKPVNLSRQIDRNIQSITWLPNNNEILAYGPDGTKDGIWIININGQFKATSFGNLTNIMSLAMNKKGEIALIAESGNQPMEIFFLKDLTSDPVQLTKYNESFKNKHLGKVVSIEWKTDINIITDGVVTYPPNFYSGKKYPLVLLIHGGPTDFSSEEFNPVTQYIASKGWIVFQPNYRGSNNRGDAFQEAVMNDGGEGPGRDVMAGIEALKRLGIVDENRIGVSGWSYGGFMTAWLIGRYPHVWKAAVAGAAGIDFTDMTSLSRMNLTLRHAITNSPWVGDNYKLHYEMSPLKNLSKIKTPTLIISKVEDQVVTVTGSYKLYHALIANKIPTKFIAYPGGGHNISDPANQMDKYDRWIGWLEEYL